MSQDLSNYSRNYYLQGTPQGLSWFFEDNNAMRPDQLAAFCYAFNWAFFDGQHKRPPRDPGLIYSIGCGMGVLEWNLEKAGCTVIGVDPSEGARELYRASTLVDRYPGGGDTVIFCESIEHIPLAETLDIFERIPYGTRIIITNWPDHHPIEPEAPFNDHITRIDDALYDRLSVGRPTVLRRGSHLVLE